MNRPGFVEARLVGSDLGEDRVLTVGLAGLGCPVGGVEVGGRDEPELAVKALWLNQSTYRLPAALGSHHGVADALGLEQRVQGLGHRVVVAVALGAHGSDSVGLSESVGVADGSVLHAPVAVMDQPGDVVAGAVAGPQPHVEGIQRQIGPAGWSTPASPRSSG